jgi:UDP-N-acetylmuramoylalanine--D-glutamate ligase
MIAVRGREGRRVAVFGLGRTGLTAARALKAGGAVPVLWDEKAGAVAAAADEGFETTDLRTADWSRFDALLLSPGVPLTHPEPHWTVRLAQAAGVPVVGDLELFQGAVDAAQAELKPQVVAITGTNGKSTTTALIGWIVERAGRPVRIGGNIGFGVLGLEPFVPRAVYVLETSSYQLDLCRGFKPDVAVWLNITPDHLDRHGSMEGYVAAKRRIFQAQGPGDTAAIGVDDVWSAETAQAVAARGGPAVVRVSAAGATEGVWSRHGVLYDGVEPVAELGRARSLPGRHNAQNAAAAYAAVRALGLTREQAVEGLLTFPGLAHRMEEVGRIGGVRFVNDSKATNADAARQALSSYPQSFWIAGGRAKEGGIEPLADLFPRVAEAFLVGEAAEAFAQTLGAVPHRVCGTIDRATEAAFAAARAAGGEQVVLLSPACASFDQFPDFEARGEAFRAAVQGLMRRAAA